MKTPVIAVLTGLSLGSGLLFGCTTQQQDNTSEQPTAGTLEFRANGEDFVREGFLTKDDWSITFDQLYVTLAEVTAYQSDPPFNSEQDSVPQATQQVTLSETMTIDLAAGDETANPILMQSVNAPSGYYNALSWKLVQGSDGITAGYPMVIQGVATKADRTIDFTLKIEQELAFVCGEFVGDERKGFLQGGETGDVEATFHFDHLFGDGEMPPDNSLNLNALGFDPLAAIASDNQLEVDLAGLKTRLSPQDYDKIFQILPSLGHVGEGHCRETVLTEQ